MALSELVGYIKWEDDTTKPRKHESMEGCRDDPEVDHAMGVFVMEMYRETDNNRRMNLLMAAVARKNVGMIRELAFSMSYQYVRPQVMILVMDSIAHMKDDLGTETDAETDTRRPDDVFLFMQTILYMMYPSDEAYDLMVTHAITMASEEPMGRLNEVLLMVYGLTREPALREKLTFMFL